MKIGEFLALLKGVKQSGAGWQALCPAHEDKRQSLHVSEGDDGRILVNCFAGCEVSQICAALGIRVSDLFPEKPERHTGGKTEIIATYDYKNMDGKLLFQVCRTADKRFFQRRPNGRGGWINGLKGVKPVLYRLPEVVAAVEAGGTVFTPEGEKDVNNLARLDLAATTSPMGAGKWRSSYNEALAGANVVVLPDNDEPGYKHAQDVAKNLHGVAASVKVLELPGLPDKGDITDWLNDGGTKAELLRLAGAAPEWEPGPEAEPAAAEPRHFTDLGNAMRLVELHGADIRYSYESKKWYCWNGKYWQEDRTGKIKRLAKKTVRQMYAEAAKIQDDRDREAFIKHALKSESENRLKAMVSLAQSETGIPILLNQFDADPFLLNCQNGTINLRTGELQEHKRGDYLTKISPIEYNPKIRSKVWETFLDRVIPDPQVRAFVQRFAGYSITGDVSEEKFAFSYGPPATGKSTFLRAVMAAAGDYACTADFEAFLSNKNRGGPRNDIARLAGKRFVVSVEVEDGRKLAEGLVNQLTGGDVITARFLYQESFEFVPQFKLWLAANNRPKVTGPDGAIWRRILQIPFREVIPANERNPELKNILCDTEITGPAILAWLVEGCLAWQQEGLNPPDAVKQTTEEYRQEMDPLADFIADKCVMVPQARVSNPEIWKAYKTWCEENGERYPLGRKRFTQTLIASGFDQYPDAGKRIWIGIGLVYDNVKN
ncbi:MAG: phage/plasmid primase, P4 family [Dethiobacteria bacterium]|jgi:putative DNA primase/helicase